MIILHIKYYSAIRKNKLDICVHIERNYMLCIMCRIVVLSWDEFCLPEGTMSETFLVVKTIGVGCSWIPVDRGQGCFLMSYNSSPQHRII